MGPVPASSDVGALLFVFVLLFFTFLLVYGIFKSSRRRETLERVARRLKGNVRGSAFSRDRLEFAVDGVAGELTYNPGSRSSSPFTRVWFRCVPAGYLRISPEGVFTWLWKMFGAQDVEFGDRAFDETFIVQGSPETWVREVLEPETRKRIEALGSLGAWSPGPSRVRIDAGPGGMTVLCSRNFVDDQRLLEAFLDQSIAVFRQIRTPAVEGIEILSAEEHVGRGECPVCASPIEGSPRRCASCGTSHHGDCWKYFGGCAIYGCARRGGRAA